jgi:hypothetical protein
MGYSIRLWLAHLTDWKEKRTSTSLRLWLRWRKGKGSLLHNLLGSVLLSGCERHGVKKFGSGVRIFVGCVCAF